MKSLLLLSVVLASLVIPALAAFGRDPRRSVRRMVLLLFVMNAVYLAYVTLVHPYVFVPKW
jgi:hypothetical protein